MSVIAGPHWVSGSASILMPESSIWLGFGNFTDWHLSMATRFFKEGIVPGEKKSCLMYENREREWGYRWGEPKKLTTPYPCYIGGRCKIQVEWIGESYQASYSKSKLPGAFQYENRHWYELRTRSTGIRLDFYFNGPAYYHLELCRSFWETNPPHETVFSYFELSAHVKIPLFFDKAPNGFILPRKSKLKLDMHDYL